MASADQEEDLTAGPLSERLVSTKWKVRQHAYIELKKLFTEAEEDTHPVYQQYAGNIKKIILEKNVIGQEAGMASGRVVDRAPVAVRHAQSLCDNMVDKCIAGRPKTKASALQAIEFLVERDCQEAVLASLLNGCKHKVPKVVCACVVAMTTLLREFGARVISAKDLLKRLASLYEHSDPKVREAVHELSVELYRQIGSSALDHCLKDLRSAQAKQLQDACSKEEGGKAMPTKFTRAAMASAQQQQMAAADDEPEEIDAFDLSDAEEVLQKLPANFYATLKSKKWKERKQAIDALIPIVNHPRLSTGDYGQLTKALKKVVQADANVMVVAKAVEAAGLLATGLRADFTASAKSMTDAMFQKLKEKKGFVLTAIHTALDAFFAYCYSLADISDELVAATTVNKVPNVRLETLKFVHRCLSNPPARLRKKGVVSKGTAKHLARMFIKALDDSNGDVRDMAAQGFGALGGIVGERQMQPLLAKLDAIKAKKVMDHIPKTTVVMPMQEPVKVAPPAERKRPAAARKPAAKPAVSKPTAAKPAAAKPAATSKPASRSSGGSKPAGTRPRAAGPGRSASSKKAGTKTRAPSKLESEPTSSVAPLLSADEAIPKAEELLTIEVQVDLSDSKWQARRDAMLAVRARVASLASEGQLAANADVLVRQLLTAPGLKDTNLTVLNSVFQCLTAIVTQSMTTFSKSAALAIVPGAVEKLGDSKLKASVGECLTAICECPPCTPRLVIDELIIASTGHRNPRVLNECVTWLEGTIAAFGMDGLSASAIVTYAKSCYASTNPQVRSSCTSLLSLLLRFVGPGLRSKLNDLKPALLTSIDREFEKVKGQAPPAPTRKVGGTVATRAAAAAAAAPLPTGPSVSPALMKELQSKDWLEQKKALQELQSLLTGPTPVKLPANVCSQLFALFKDLLQSQNSNLVTQTLRTMPVFLDTAAASGVLAKHYRQVAPGALACLGDNKKSVVIAAVGACESLAGHVGMRPLLEYCVTVLDNVLARKETVALMNKFMPPMEHCDVRCLVKPVLACVQDKSAEVRRLSQTLLGELMARTSYETIMRACKGYNQTKMCVIGPILEKLNDTVVSKRPAGSAPMEEEDEEEAPVAPASALAPGASLAVDDRKNLRALEEANFAWFQQQPEDVHVQILRSQAEGCVSEELFANLFSHTAQGRSAALAALLTALSSEKKGTVACLDVILKWITLRLTEGDVKMIVAVLAYVVELFSVLDMENYTLSDYEAQCFLPPLVSNLGTIYRLGNARDSLLALLKSICRVYATGKVFQLVLAGVSSEDADTAAESMIQLAAMVNSKGIAVCSTQAALYYRAAEKYKQGPQHVTDASLVLFAACHQCVGDELWTSVSSVLSGQQRDQLKEQVSRTDHRRLSGISPLAAAPADGAEDSLEEEDSTASLLASWYETMEEADETATVPVLKEIGRCFEQSSISLAESDTLFLHMEALTKAVYAMEPISFRFANYVVRTWMLLFSNSVFAHSVSLRTLQTVIKRVLCELQNPNVASMPDKNHSQYLLSVLNRLVISVLDNSDRTQAFLVLFGLLHEAVAAADPARDKFIEYTCKCLLKLAKTLRATIETIDLVEMLRGINSYFTTTPKNVDHPMNPHATVKTILNELVRLEGANIIPALDKAIPQDSEAQMVHSYVARVLGNTTIDISKQVAAVRPQLQALRQQQVQKAEEEEAREAVAEAEESSAVSDKRMLLDIFTKVRSKDITESQDALVTLHSFLKEHGTSEFDGALAKTSEVFREYIRCGLANIEEDILVHAGAEEELLAAASATAEPTADAAAHEADADGDTEPEDDLDVPEPVAEPTASEPTEDEVVDDDDDFPEELLEDLPDEDEYLDEDALEEAADEALEEEEKAAEEKASTFQQAESYLQRLARVQEGLNSLAVVRTATAKPATATKAAEAEPRTLLDLKQRLALVKARSPTKSPTKPSILAQVNPNVPTSAGVGTCATSPASAVAAVASGDSTKKLADIRAWIENVKATKKN
eukprot:CAMPEP_0114608830 /NCGR_PEP_ID=MMETSP0168-20121206/2779_1 /TAXON_ID=95228 ORGANISM="Vannella sp., Strain DIVA3 517/6/12" /NCGR_SAMPLE_ID=MMETSP0168 /ASSEMBLY_ACC=CAM_ASM_000044 /LENGTH=2000 /DNA_ID=CAMNT_0001819737 /DNA_START=45 /DNA_END=6048 /DNA_ORIENTATION=-